MNPCRLCGGDLRREGNQVACTGCTYRAVVVVEKPLIRRGRPGWREERERVRRLNRRLSEW